jgi:hypothetical protein
LSLDELKSFIEDTLCDGELRLTSDDVAAITLLERDYLQLSSPHEQEPDF